ncbi:BF3164 family lipoprotein [Parapedobacter sp. 10938]|uniref:BF3164 family lipoprotein n=1 Tax=Parapedobacter flavus TaxID=3110225 RepID=UPI002DB6B0AE|nr:hypothetical protein [Parapedobacter sp. 10938]MEC3881794.1 hypothetical protein [Parapedobacter sp. 10938]
MSIKNQIQAALSSIIIVCFISCRENDKNNQDGIQIIDTKDLDELVSTHLTTIDSSCFQDGEVLDSMLLLIDYCNSDVFYGYDLTTFKPLVATGTNGKGPGDFISVPFFSVSNNNTELAVWDPSGYLKYIDEFNPEIKASESRFLDPQFMGSRYVAIADNRIYGNKFKSGKGNIFYQEGNGGGLSWIEPPRYIKDHAYGFIHGEEFMQPFLENCFTIGGEGDRKFLAVGMKYYNTIYFMDTDGNLVKSFQLDMEGNGENIIVPQGDRNSEFFSPETTVFVYDVYSTDKFIYFLSYGSSSSNFREKHEGGKSQLFVFDIDMNFVKGVTLDRKLGFICVSNDNERLFGGAIGNSGVSAMVEYQLNL